LLKNQNDPLYIILRSKKEATRFQILVEIAENQPALRQQEIAAKLGVTPQAVSEYIRELVDDEMVASQGRGSYTITPKGVEWVTNNAEALESYSKHITRDIIRKVSVWTAIAECDIKKGDIAGVTMKDGYLRANLNIEDARGEAISDAKAGMDIGISGLKGIINHHSGIVHVCKVPRIERGGSKNVRPEMLRDILEKSRFTGAVGIEAEIAIINAGGKADSFFGAREGVIEAAVHGLDCAVVIVDEEFTDFLKRLETANLRYVIHDLISR
jgi:putative transcriptional regulator